MQASDLFAMMREIQKQRMLENPRGYSLAFNMGGPCQYFLADPQILSLTFWGPQILSPIFWRPAPNSTILPFFRFVDPKY